jgi:hypothetical protein
VHADHFFFRYTVFLFELNMSTEQVDENQPLPVEVNDWNGLYQYVNKSR